MSKVRNEGARERGGGWRVARLAFLVALVLEAVDGLVGILETDPSLRVSGLATVGQLALVGLAAYGVWRRTRWGAWLGGVIAVLAVVLLPLSLLSPQTRDMQLGAAQLGASPLSLAVMAAKVLAYAIFLAALLRIRLSRRV